jgi:hypothetical protein
MFFNNQGETPNDWDSYEAYMKDSFDFQDDQDSMIANFDTDFLDAMPGNDDDGVSDLDFDDVNGFNGIPSNQMQDEDEPVYSRRRRGHRRRPRAREQPAKTKDPWDSHPMGPPLPQAPYVDRPAGPYLPMAGPISTHASADWGVRGTSGSPAYGTGAAAIPPYETKVERKARKQREKEAVAQQKAEQKMREEQAKQAQKEQARQAKEEMLRETNPEKYQREMQKRQEKETKQKFKYQKQQPPYQTGQRQPYGTHLSQPALSTGQQQYHATSIPQTKLEKERMK